MDGVCIYLDGCVYATSRKVSSRKMKFHCKGDMLRGRVSHVAADSPNTLYKTFGTQVRRFLLETRSSKNT